MASYFYLTLDTLAPQGVTLKINNDEPYTTSNAVSLTIGTTDASTDGYQMKIWGTSTAITESLAEWEPFETSKTIILPSGDGLKRIYVRLRDVVLNESAVVSAQIILDVDIPIVNVTGPDVSTISTIAGVNASNFSFVVNELFVEFKVKVVFDSTSLHDTGIQIPTTGGSINMFGQNEDGFSANTAINCTINGIDLQKAYESDGTKIIKVFAKDRIGNWSVM